LGDFGGLGGTGGLGGLWSIANSSHMMINNKIIIVINAVRIIYFTPLF